MMVFIFTRLKIKNQLQKLVNLLLGMIKNNYISVIGLEIHIQLSTKSKAYSADENIYGANPNTKISHLFHLHIQVLYLLLILS